MHVCETDSLSKGCAKCVPIVAILTPATLCPLYQIILCLKIISLCLTVAMPALDKAHCRLKGKWVVAGYTRAPLAGRYCTRICTLEELSLFDWRVWLTTLVVISNLTQEEFWVPPPIFDHLPSMSVHLSANTGLVLSKQSAKKFTIVAKPTFCWTSVIHIWIGICTINITWIYILPASINVADRARIGHHILYVVVRMDNYKSVP